MNEKISNERIDRITLDCLRAAAELLPHCESDIQSLSGKEFEESLELMANRVMRVYWGLGQGVANNKDLMSWLYHRGEDLENRLKSSGTSDE